MRIKMVLARYSEKSTVQIRITVLTFGLRLGLGSALRLGLGLVEIIDFQNSGPSK